MKTKRHIQTLVFTVLLLLVGGMTNGAWATVTYHILTKPITTYKYDGTVLRNNIRLEALRCTSSASTVGLPDDFKSPLAKNYTYYTTATITYQTIYDTTGAGDGKVKGINTQYDCYTDLGSTVSAGDAVGATTDIYVTYEYDESAATSLNIDLTGGKEYNVKLGDRFLCFNKDRANRPGAILSGNVTAENLSAEDFSYVTTCDYSDKYHSFHFRFKFTGSDPYNITIMSAYDLETVFDETNNDNKSVVVKKQFKGSSLFSKMFNNMWLASDANKRWKGTSVPEADTMQGFYRGNNNEMNPIFDAFVLLNHTSGSGYVFVGSKMNTNGSTNQPNNNQYYYLTGYVNNGNNPQIQRKSAANADVTNLYEIKTYTYKVKTPLTGTVLTADMEWSDAMLNENPANHVPEALKRKYCNYTAYSDEECTTPANTFQAIQDAKNGMNIYLKYTVSESMPFEALSKTGNYQNARWYTMRMNGKAEAKNIAYKAESSNAFITSPTIGNNTNLHTGENSAEAMVAFMGDPYELKILNRKACEGATGNRFIGCATTASSGDGLTTDKTGSSDISTWEIVYDTESGNFVLREFGTAATTPMYIGWGTDGSKPVTYSATESRIRVVELEKVTYTYHIMRNNDGDIAVKASSTHDIGKMLNSWMDIPDIIRSPFLSTATVTYYASLADAKAKTNAITNAPYDYSTNDDIYVRYDVSISGSTYNVRLNNEYIYTDGTDIIKNKPLLDDGDKDDGAFQWLLDYSDPYHMTIKNVGKGAFVNVAFSDGASINWSDDTPSYFVAKSGSIVGTYEVMAATGDGIDASVTYYNIGRPSANTVKLYSNSSYIHGNAVLRFQLIGTNATRIYYHLIDKKGKDLLQATTRQATTDNPAFPPEYYSPLVDRYYYHKTQGHAIDHRYEDDNFDSGIGGSEVYVTYDVNDLVDLKAGQLYLMKYEAGETFHQENGSDGVNPTAQKAVYPYVNGDGNFFVYGQDQYNLQQEGASSTRTRWAWYVESDADGKGDPYHVKIKSRQTESYPITNSTEYNAYFMTYKPGDYSQVITTLGWPGMNSETATEYMVLGSEGQYQLVTTNTIPIDLNTDGDTEDEGENVRYVVDSFEQYWKTFDTIKKKIYGSSKEDDDDPIIIPNDVTKGSKTLRNYLKEDLVWHSYEKWAYAKRWNGYNNGYSSEEGTHEKKKGWEKIEHWYQTVSMGQGYFDFVKTSVNPVLILLDQHGFEIMRKPLPTDPEDPDKTEKYAAIRPYNSPMVKEYAFWATAKKRTGLHQYYALADRIGDNFTSTDLTNLPPYGSKNVKDKKGNLNDQYVTYIVKDEYAQTYTPKTKEGKEFLIEQGSKYASTDGSTITKNDVSSVTDMNTYILSGHVSEDAKWYVKPNADIDTEMGYDDVSHTWTDPDPTDSKKWKNKNPNAYDHYKFKDKLVASYISDKVLTDSLGYFSFSNGFDPYNIQIQSVQASTKYMNTNATNATLEEGSMIGVYTDSPAISLDENDAKISPKWYDSRNLSVTNATFMAVQDAAGNMQLMPRFDHATRMSEFGTLIAPTDAQVATTYTKLYRPVVYEYLIIDNDGHESLRYKSGGDLTPQTPDHFKSPLATNFTYYSNATKDGDTYTIDKTKEIEGALDAATLDANNTVYVRYEYDEEADDYLKILRGNWLTMQLNKIDAKYDGGIKQGTKPETIGDSQRAWQWKFTESPQSAPDPYALYIFNRSQAGTKQAGGKRFALLSHSPGYYALAEAGLGTAEDYNYTYNFLNGSSMDESTAATIAVESGFTPTSGTYSETDSQVKLYNDVTHTFTYKVYTNGGVNAIDASQTQEEVLGNNWQPVLPEAARTPLLNIDQYRYYEQNLSVTTPDTIKKSLSQLYGLYDDIVYTHYTPYNVQKSSYLVPNVRNATSETTVARGDGSNDTPLGLIGSLLYNFIWYNDKMMKSNDKVIEDGGKKDLQPTADFEWKLEGNDPYAIKIHSVGANRYIKKADSSNSCDLSGTSETATTFMLLNKDDYDYGVLTMTGSAITSQTPLMLSGYGNVLTNEAPNHFIPFALATYKVIYHLMIKNIGSEGVIIPFRKANEGPDKIKYTKIKEGTTLRDLTETYQLGKKLSDIGALIGGDHDGDDNIFNRDSLYCYDVGPISLGDALEMPQQLSRPNVEYTYYVEGVYNASGAPNTAMDGIYKGLKVDHMGDNAGLLGQVVLINAVYKFMGGLDTNAGSDFVGSVADNKWYTYEANEATTKLAQYTGTLQTVSGYATHYTNDYLWTPVGDPYGFKMYNRYLSKNLGEKMVMSTTDFETDTHIEMVPDYAYTPYVPHEPANSVYELLATSTTTPGYFNVHPVVNKDGDQYYMYDNSGTIQLSTTPTEWTFGLSEEVMKPYYQSAGYIGGLNVAGKAAYDTAASEDDPLQRLMDLQDVVYNHDNNNPEDDQTNPNYIVHYTPGFYRLHSQPGSSGITTPRYMSGYTHKTELTPGTGTVETPVAIPLHFYEVEEYDMNDPTFGDLSDESTPDDDDFTITPATRGNIPLVTVTYDPASIFQFTGAAAASPSSTMQTQGLYVKGNKMTATAGEATSFNIIDIGAGIIALQGGDKFLKYAQNEMKYDLKFDNTAATVESARWCMKPVQKAKTAGNGEMALDIATRSDGDKHRYATFYAPFDVLLTDAAKDTAYVVVKWPTITGTTAVMHPKRIGQFNTAENSCPESYRGNDQFIPANTPVIIRTTNTTNHVTVVMPTATPSKSVSCVFTGTYLEQMLAQDAGNLVYVFGRSYTHSDEFSYVPSSGVVTPQGLDFDKGVGFYKNANTNRESNPTKTEWSRNNKYVYANKVYYYAGGISGDALNIDFENTEYIPVLFDDQGVKDMDLQPDGTMRLRINEGRVYDLQGRCVATEQEVSDGSWLNNVAPGMYIVNGKKFVIE